MNWQIEPPYAQDDVDGLRLAIHVQPGASKSEFCGVHGDSLKLKISARPVDGAANRAVIEFLADFFGLAKSSVSILRGETSRNKLVLLKGNRKELLASLKRI